MVNGQRNMQASSDVFLGWVTGPAGANYYWRQLWDAKLSVDVETDGRRRAASLRRACGWALARAHARSGSPIAIAAYMGTTATLRRAMTAFAEAYADQNDRDHEVMQDEVKAGRLAVA